MIHLTLTGPSAGVTFCGAPRNEVDSFNHATYVDFTASNAKDICPKCWHEWEESDDEASPAFKAILAATKGHIEAFVRDVFVHDKALIMKHADGPFLYYFRDSGSHLFPLKKVSEEEEGDYRSQALEGCWLQNSHHWFWTGSELLPISHEKAQEILRNHQVIKF